MPAFRTYEDFIAAVSADVLIAWPDTKKIYEGEPRVVPNVWPYAVIALNPESPMTQEWDSVQGLTQKPNVTITRVATLPADKTVSVQGLQVEKANSLIARLERNSYYQRTDATNVARNPVGMLSALPTPGEKDAVYEVDVMFTCETRELHTSKLS